MKMFFQLVLAAIVARAAALKSKVTPVQQVLDMLGEMKTKGEKMMIEEQKIYTEYSHWVHAKTEDLANDIKTEEMKIEKLTAFIEEAENKVASLAKSIAQDESDIATLEEEKAAAIKIRETEKAEFIKVEQDHAESVDALERAIEVLGAQDYSRSQAESLLQKMAKQKPAMRMALAAFLQEEVSQDGAPAVAAYKFQSSSIMDLLEKLLKKFKTQLDDVQTDESNRAHAFKMQDEHLANEIGQLSKEKERKAEDKANTAAASAKAQGDLATSKSDKKDDEEFKAHIEATFEEKSRAFNTNQEVRKQELEALNKAIEIIASPDVAESYSTHVNSALNQVSSHPAAFVQLRSTKRRVTARQRAAELLQKRAKALNSQMLRTLAEAMGATEDNPFAKVVTMIEDLLARLKSEAAAEAEHKAWCDEQLKENKHKRDKKTIAVEKLTAKIQKLTGEIETMAEEIDILLKEQAEITKAMAEATEVRQKEKAENLATIADAKAGSAAVANALTILQQFYEGQASFLQRGKQVPEMAEYKGMSGGGVIGMLEVIQTDFLRLEADTKAAEAQAAKEYDEFMAESEATKKRKHAEEVQLKLDKDQSEFEKGELQKDLAAEQADLDAANKYYAELKPQCLTVHVSWEERVARREEELAALNEAYEILSQKSA
jgi:hypothetical protein